MDVIKMHIDEMKDCNELKVTCNAEIDARNKILSGDKSRSAEEEFRRLYIDKNNKIRDILEYRKTRTECDENISNELKNVGYKDTKWFCY